MERPVIGCVPYLNAKPLIAWFDTPAGHDQVEIQLEVPSKLALWLADRKIACAMLSSFESFRRGDTVIVPGISIADKGRVKSVRLFSKVPFGKIERVALDQSSLTSNALTQILLSELFGVEPYYESRPPKLDAMLNEFDAGLLIGDPGMSASGEGLHVLDLGEAWNELTSLPFVWAVWLANEEQCSQPLVQSLQEAQAYGLARIESVADYEAKRLDWSYDICLDYLQNIMDYHLAEDHLDGLKAYQQLCFKHGLIEELHPIRLADYCGHLATE